MKKLRPVIVSAPNIYNSSLIKSLNEKGFQALSFPVIETLVYDNPSFNEIFKKIGSFDFIILPSKTAINSFLTQISKRNISLNSLKAQVIAIGKDYDYLKKRHFKHILKPKEPSTQGIVDSLKKPGKNKNILVLIPKVENIPEPVIIPELLVGLKKIGNIHAIDAYITKPISNIPSEIEKIILSKEYEFIAVTSGGEASALKKLFPIFYTKLKIACFGPYTEKTAVNEGFKPIFTGEKFSSFTDFAEELKIFLEASL